jgi:hypothetical protein
MECTGGYMDRTRIIKKAMEKLSLSVVKKIEEDKMKEHINGIKRLVMRLKPDDLEAPKTFLKLFGEMIDREKYEKEEIQEILTNAKKMGLIKKSMRSNKFMERAWRAILKNFDLKGFLLEN